MADITEVSLRHEIFSDVDVKKGCRLIDDITNAIISMSEDEQLSLFNGCDNEKIDELMNAWDEFTQTNYSKIKLKNCLPIYDHLCFKERNEIIVITYLLSMKCTSYPMTFFDTYETTSCLYIEDLQPYPLLGMLNNFDTNSQTIYRESISSICEYFGSVDNSLTLVFISSKAYTDMKDYVEDLKSLNVESIIYCNVTF